MKKAFVLIIAIVVLLSITSSSLADISRDDAEKISGFDKFFGNWYSHEVKNTGLEYDCAISIGFSDDVVCVINTQAETTHYNWLYTYKFYPTYDKDEETLYLSSEGEMVMKIKLEDGNLIVKYVSSLDAFFEGNTCIMTKLG